MVNLVCKYNIAVGDIVSTGDALVHKIRGIWLKVVSGCYGNVGCMTIRLLKK